MSRPTLDLALIGNGIVSALIDGVGRIVWSCLPRFDGDPVFCSLLRTDDTLGVFAIEIADFARAEQHYLDDTAVLVTRLHDRHGGGVEITDFAPRATQPGTTSPAMMLVRRLRRIGVPPRLTLRVRPACDEGARRPETEVGEGHLRYRLPGFGLRLSTDAPIAAVSDEIPFTLADDVTLMLGPDEAPEAAVGPLGHRLLDETAHCWREWVRALMLPGEWRKAVIRAGITLELNVCADTGAIVAAMTTSVPEAADSGRNWDYRFCWLRDSCFVVQALNRLGATHAMERYLAWLQPLIDAAARGPLQPVYRIDGSRDLEERIVSTLPGYRGMGPVRVGNQAYRQVQHDSYGSILLAVEQVFFDERAARRGDEALFRRLEPLGELAARNHDQPDAGLWELRGSARVHTYSAVMCWVACDRLARIATRLALHERASHWRAQADRIHRTTCEQAWNEQRRAFASTFGGETMDASLLLMADLGFLAADDPRFAATVDAIAHDLKRGDFVFRYVERDDFGEPENAFLVCTFWYVGALAAIGRREEARALFDKLLATRNRHGLLPEHADPRTGEHWGNFPQTYSMAGIIGAAQRLSAAA